MKRIFSGLICFVLTFMAVIPAGLLPVKASEDLAHKHVISWFKNELSSDEAAMAFYQAMETLYSSGGMKSGVGSVDLSNRFTQTELKRYAQGDAGLAIAFQKARDAFDKDHPEIFYVDFTKLSLRFGMKNTTYVLYLNNGSNANYYTDGFTGVQQVEKAIAEVNQAKNEVEGTITDAMRSNPVSMISAVHQALIERTEYTYPSKNDTQVASIYGALVNGKANCDGYSRAFNWIMNDLDIPSVLVAGVARNARYEEQSKEEIDQVMQERHQWNYVKIKDSWFAVDVTWDDPIKAVKTVDGIRVTYLLRGSDTMDENHFPMGQLSPNGYTFSYPTLEQADYDKLSNQNEIEDYNDLTTDLKVSVEKVVDDISSGTDDLGNAFVSTKYAVSYQGLSMEQLNAKGLYLGVRFGVDGVWAGWQDATVFPNAAQNQELFTMRSYKAGLAQFCITDQPMPEHVIYYPQDLSEPGNHVLVSKKMSTPYFSNYAAPAFVRTSQPALTGATMPKKTHYKVEFDKELVFNSDEAIVAISLTNSASHIQAKIENTAYSYGTFQLPDGSTHTSTFIEFDFTPDASFQGYANTYTIQVENMVDKNSRKLPKSFPIITTYKPVVPCPIAVAHGAIPNAFVMSNPTLIVDDNLEDIFTTSHGSQRYGALNIALIATKTVGQEKQELDAMINDQLTTATSSATYELNLGCAALAAALRPGYHVSVGVPYPEGFHPEDFENVEFRAFHYKKVNGVYVPEEIVCQITPAGLMIIADNFSPFTIAMYPKGEAPASTLKEKTVLVSAETAGGMIETTQGGAGMYSVAPQGSRSFAIKADEGYVIERILINQEEVKLSDDEEYNISFAYDSMEQSNEVKVSFVAKSVKQQEAEKGIAVITPVLTPDNKEQQIYLDREVVAALPGVMQQLHVSGMILQDADLIVQALDDANRQILVEQQRYRHLVASGIPAFTKEDASKGELKLKLAVDASYNGKQLSFVTYEAGQLHKQSVIAQNGMVELSVKKLTAFSLLDEIVDRTTLQALLKECEKINQSLNLYESGAAMDAYRKAYDTALAVAGNDAASEEDLLIAYHNLWKSVNQLQLKEEEAGKDDNQPGIGQPDQDQDVDTGDTTAVFGYLAAALLSAAALGGFLLAGRRKQRIK